MSETRRPLDDPTPPAFVVQGLRARPMRHWRDGLMVLLMMLSPLTVTGADSVSGAGVAVICALVAVAVGWFLWRVSRGRISVFDDRIEIFAWDDVLPRDAMVLRFAEIVRFSLFDNRFRIYRENPGAQPDVYRITISAPIAEELFDQIVEAMERDPRVEVSLDSRSATQRSAVRREH